jgi:hypothetical protein
LLEHTQGFSVEWSRHGYLINRHRKKNSVIVSQLDLALRLFEMTGKANRNPD